MVGRDSFVKTSRLCDLQRWVGASRNTDVEFLVVLMGRTMWQKGLIVSAALGIPRFWSLEES